MIPALNEHGYLPPGIHPATMGEVIDRFGHGSDQREAEAQSLTWLLPICRRAGITRLLINGGFISDSVAPNDVDCILLQGPTYSAMSPAAAELREGMPFLELRILTEDDYAFYSEIFFATDRDMIPKGMVEVTL